MFNRENRQAKDNRKSDPHQSKPPHFRQIGAERLWRF